MTKSPPQAKLPAHLGVIHPVRSMSALLLDWLLIACCFGAAIWLPHPLTYLVAAILIARTQLALAVLMHESAHGLLLPNRKWNDWIGQWLTAAPLMLSLFAYRSGHLQHHRAPMAKDDPVATVFGIADYPVSRSELAWRLFKDVSSIGYFLAVRDFAIGKHRHLKPAQTVAEPSRGIMVLASILVSNATLAGLLAATGHGWLYLGLWIVPALTFLQLFARIRAITEHAGYPAHEDQLQNARTIVSPSWQTFFCGPHAIHYHMEHHHYVRAPFYHLSTIHKLMLTDDALPHQNLYHGYGKVFSDVTRLL